MPPTRASSSRKKKATTGKSKGKEPAVDVDVDVDFIADGEIPDDFPELPSKRDHYFQVPTEYESAQEDHLSMVSVGGDKIGTSAKGQVLTGMLVPLFFLLPSASCLQDLAPEFLHKNYPRMHMTLTLQVIVLYCLQGANLSSLGRLLGDKDPSRSSVLVGFWNACVNLLGTDTLEGLLVKEYDSYHGGEASATFIRSRATYLARKIDLGAGGCAHYMAGVIAQLLMNILPINTINWILDGAITKQTKMVRTHSVMCHLVKLMKEGADATKQYLTANYPVNNIYKYVCGLDPAKLQPTTHKKNAIRTDLGPAPKVGIKFPFYDWVLPSFTHRSMWIRLFNRNKMLLVGSALIITSPKKFFGGFSISKSVVDGVKDGCNPNNWKALCEFVKNFKTGDFNPIPDSWFRNPIEKAKNIAYRNPWRFGSSVIALLLVCSVKTGRTITSAIINLFLYMIAFFICNAAYVVFLLFYGFLGLLAVTISDGPLKLADSAILYANPPQPLETACVNGYCHDNGTCTTAWNWQPGGFTPAHCAAEHVYMEAMNYTETDKGLNLTNTMYYKFEINETLQQCVMKAPGLEKNVTYAVPCDCEPTPVLHGDWRDFMVDPSILIDSKRPSLPMMTLEYVKRDVNQTLTKLQAGDSSALYRSTTITTLAILVSTIMVLHFVLKLLGSRNERERRAFKDVKSNAAEQLKRVTEHEPGELYFRRHGGLMDYSSYDVYVFTPSADGMDDHDSDSDHSSESVDHPSSTGSSPRTSEEPKHSRSKKQAGGQIVCNGVPYVVSVPVTQSGSSPKITNDMVFGGLDHPELIENPNPTSEMDLFSMGRCDQMTYDSTCVQMDCTLSSMDHDEVIRFLHDNAGKKLVYSLSDMLHRVSHTVDTFNSLTLEQRRSLLKSFYSKLHTVDQHGEEIIVSTNGAASLITEKTINALSMITHYRERENMDPAYPESIFASYYNRKRSPDKTYLDNIREFIIQRLALVFWEINTSQEKYQQDFDDIFNDIWEYIGNNPGGDPGAMFLNSAFRKKYITAIIQVKWGGAVLDTVESHLRMLSANYKESFEKIKANPGTVNFVTLVQAKLDKKKKSGNGGGVAQQ